MAMLVRLAEGTIRAVPRWTLEYSDASERSRTPRRHGFPGPAATLRGVEVRGRTPGSGTAGRGSAGRHGRARDQPPARPLPGEQAREDQVGRGRLRVRAARRQAENRGPPSRASHSIEPGCDGTPWLTISPPSSSTGRRTGPTDRSTGRRRSRTRSTGPSPPASAPQLRTATSSSGGVVDRHELRAQGLHLRPDAGLESLPRDALDRLLDDNRDAHRLERRDADDRTSASTRRAPAATAAAATRCGPTLMLATAGRRGRSSRRTR